MNKKKITYDSSKDSYRQFYATFLYVYSDFVGLNSRELNYMFSSCFIDKNMEYQILSLIHQNPDIPFLDLAARIGILCSNETPSHYLAKLRTLQRGDNEPIMAFAVRCRLTLDQAIPPENFNQMVGTQW